MSTDKSSAKEEIRFNVRITPELHARIVQRAKANGHSMNSEIIDILENAMSSEEEGRAEHLREKLAAVSARMEAANREMQALDSHRKLKRGR